MKNATFFTLFLLFSFKMQAQWLHTTPALDDTIGISDTEVLDAQTAFGIGHRYGVNDTFYSFGVPSEVHFIRTIDGGATTSVSKMPLAGAPFIANMTATDANTAFVIGLSDFANAFTMKTTDGGTTWANAGTPWDAAKSWPDFIHAFTVARICVIGDPRDGEFEIYNSLNGGQFWQPVPPANISDPLAGEFGFNNIGDASGNTIWFGTSAGRVFRSKNAGLTWEAFQTPLISVGIMSFSDDKNGIVSGNNSLTESQLFSTADGGETWTDITPSASNFRLTGLECIPNSPFILMNRSTGSILKSSNFSTWISADHGATWTQIGSGDNVGWPEFLDGSTGFGGEFMQLQHKTRFFRYNGSPLVGLFQPQKLELEITLAPNPAAEKIGFDWPEKMAGDAALVLVNDLAGRLLFSKKMMADGRFELDLEGFSSGCFVLTVSTEKGSASFEFLKN